MIREQLDTDTDIDYNSLEVVTDKDYYNLNDAIWDYELDYPEEIELSFTNR